MIIYSNSKIVAQIKAIIFRLQSKTRRLTLSVLLISESSCCHLQMKKIGRRESSDSQLKQSFQEWMNNLRCLLSIEQCMVRLSWAPLMRNSHRWMLIWATVWALRWLVMKFYCSTGVVTNRPLTVGCSPRSSLGIFHDLAANIVVLTPEAAASTKVPSRQLPTTLLSKWSAGCDLRSARGKSRCVNVRFRLWKKLNLDRKLKRKSLRSSSRNSRKTRYRKFMNGTSISRSRN